MRHQFKKEGDGMETSALHKKDRDVFAVESGGKIAMVHLYRIESGWFAHVAVHDDPDGDTLFFGHGFGPIDTLDAAREAGSIRANQLLGGEARSGHTLQPVAIERQNDPGNFDAAIEAINEAGVVTDRHFVKILSGGAQGKVAALETARHALQHVGGVNEAGGIFVQALTDLCSALAAACERLVTLATREDLRAVSDWLNPTWCARLRTLCGQVHLDAATRLDALQLEARLDFGRAWGEVRHAGQAEVDKGELDECAPRARSAGVRVVLGALGPTRRFRAMAHVSEGPDRDSHKIDRFVVDAAASNVPACVTGVLLFGGGRSIQYIEGSEDGLTASRQRVYCPLPEPD